jgi:GTP cyclohydrolase I
MTKRVRKLTQEDVASLADTVALYIRTEHEEGRMGSTPGWLEAQGNDFALYGVPRGGVPAMFAVQAALERLEKYACIVNDPAMATVLVDDIVDSGTTRNSYLRDFPDAMFVSLVPALENGPWVVFPWEENESASARDIPIRLLQYIGEDVERGGLLETPERFLKAWTHWTSGYGVNPRDVLKVFEDGAQEYNEMVLVRDIPVYSQCEHHLAPFFGVAHVAYVPNGSIVGLSKLARLVDMYARRLQVQERMTAQIADALVAHLKPKGVGVVVQCRHMCMESRGIQRQGATTVTSALKGCMNDPAARAEFLKLTEGGTP